MVYNIGMSSKEPTVLKVRKYQVFTEKDVNTKVFLTGDWHVSPIVSSRQYEFLEEALAETNPEVIILQGDLVDSPIELTRETSLMKLMRELKLCASYAPTVMVLGSHDIAVPGQDARETKTRAIGKWQAITEKCEVQLLMDDWYELPEIRIFGAMQDEDTFQIIDKKGAVQHKDQPEKYEEYLEHIDFSRAEREDRIAWFAGHAPMLTDRSLEILENFDVLSFGHTHGGIIPRGVDEIMEKTGGHRGIISPNSGLFPGRMRGAIDLPTGNTMVINPGMVGAQFCAPKLAQNLNFVKAAEVSLVEVGPKEAEESGE